MAKAKAQGKMIANNKKAYHDYFILDTYEAGIALAGTEVKSLRMGKCSIKESFIRIEDGEVFIYGMHISPYEKGNIFNKDPLRVRKLLLHRSEINKLLGKTKEQGITIMPLTMLTNGQESTVKKITGKDEVRTFLKNLGFVEGGTVSVVNEIGGNLIVKVKGTRIALSRNMANRIMV